MMLDSHTASNVGGTTRERNAIEKGIEIGGIEEDEGVSNAARNWPGANGVQSTEKKTLVGNFELCELQNNAGSE